MQYGADCKPQGATAYGQGQAYGQQAYGQYGQGHVLPFALGEALIKVDARRVFKARDKTWSLARM